MATSITRHKKGGIWFMLIPVLVIVVLLIVKKFDFGRKTISPTSSQVTSDTPLPTSKDMPNGLYTTLFSPQDLVDMIDRNEDYIAGVCKKKNFEYNELRDSIYEYKNANEGITTWRDNPNKLNYCVQYETQYLSFISEINKLNPIKLEKGQHDKDYPDSSHLLVKDCAFIPIGYKKEYGGYCVAAIRKDKINSVGDLAKKLAQKADSEKNELMLEQIGHSYFRIKGNNTNIYFAPDATRKKDDILNTTHNVYTRAEKNGFKYIIYESNGSLDSAWVLKDDVFYDSIAKHEHDQIELEKSFDEYRELLNKSR